MHHAGGVLRHDIDRRKVVFIADGKDAGTVAEFADHVDAHNSDASRIKEVCIDMSGAFIKGVTENLTEAEITFDKFVHAEHGSAMTS